MAQQPDVNLLSDQAIDHRVAIATLTPRQLEVLSLLAEGYSNPTIAEKLILTTKSVENYVNAIFQKLELSPSSEDNEQFHPRVKAARLFMDYMGYARAMVDALGELTNANSPYRCSCRC